MSKVYIEIVQWPGGQGLDIGNENGSTSVAGVHGGGIGHTIKRFVVDVKKLKEAIDDNKFGEDE